MSPSAERYYPNRHNQKPTMVQHNNIHDDDDDDDEQSLSESCLSDDGGVGDRRKQPAGEEDDFASRSSMSSMSMFMSSLVGLHSDDWSFCLQVDNAKPRDLPPQPLPSMVASAPDSSSVVNITRRNNGLSRWESTPKSGPNTPVAQNTRPRAMRPWRHPGSSNSNNSNSGSSASSSNTRKLDVPIMRPQRLDSNRSLNAKRPQRLDSNRSLIPELSISDLSKPPTPTASSSSNQGAPNLPNRYDHSMDLRVLLECEEDACDDVPDNDDSGEGVFLKIPTMAHSQQSLWGSASTMTASFRTMASNRSLMSHYSISSLVPHSNNTTINSNSSLNSSNRSLFCKTEEERPIRPPRRTRSRELHFQTNASPRPVRRPVRSPSDRSMLSSATPDTATDIPAATADATTSACTTSLLPALNLHESTSNLSFRLVRSLSEQTLETTVLCPEGFDSNATINPKDTFGRYTKRTLSDSLLCMSQELNVSIPEHSCSNSVPPVTP